MSEPDSMTMYMSNVNPRTLYPYMYARLRLKRSPSEPYSMAMYMSSEDDSSRPFTMRRGPAQQVQPCFLTLHGLGTGLP